MTDIRKYAQAVIDVLGDDGSIFYNYGFDGIEAVEALRQALAAPVEPVAKIVRNETGHIRLVDSNGDSFDVSKHIGTKLYTTPPSIDALIAEAVAKEREACAKVCEETTAAWTENLYNDACVDCAEAIRARGPK